MPSEFEAFCREAAAVRGIHPDTAVLVFGAEGGFDEPAVRADFPTGTSWWAPQLHYAGGIDPKAGLGDDFTKLTGWQPGDPRAWRDALRYALNVAKKDGWRQWYAAAKVGVSRWYGIDRTAAWDANAETWDYERPKEQPVPNGKTTTIATDDVNFRAGPGTSFAKLHAPLKQGTPVWLTDAPPVTAEGHTWKQVSLGLVGYIAEELLSGSPVKPDVPVNPRFNPDAPVVTQDTDWDCAQQATLWALTAIGRHPDDNWMEADMLARGVESLAVGLTDASGAKLAAWIRDQYGEFGIGAYNLAPVSFAQVSHLAGTTPVLIGGHGWGAAGHWAGVRRYRDDVLEIAQVGGHGPIYGQQTLDRAAWDSRGPWSAVVITGGTA